jgi:hypothetical protein
MRSYTFCLSSISTSWYGSSYVTSSAHSIYLYKWTAKTRLRRAKLTWLPQLRLRDALSAQENLWIHCHCDISPTSLVRLPPYVDMSDLAIALFTALETSTGPCFFCRRIIEYWFILFLIIGCPEKCNPSTGSDDFYKDGRVPESDSLSNVKLFNECNLSGTPQNTLYRVSLSTKKMTISTDNLCWASNARHTSLPESEALPSVGLFAECLLSGTRQRRLCREPHSVKLGSRQRACLPSAEHSAQDLSGTIIRGTLKTPNSQLVTPISIKLQRPDGHD